MLSSLKEITVIVLCLKTTHFVVTAWKLVLLGLYFCSVMAILVEAKQVSHEVLAKLLDTSQVSATPDKFWWMKAVVCS